MNYIGVLLAIISAIILLFVKVETLKENEPVLIDNIEQADSDNELSINLIKPNEDKDIFDTMSKTKKRIVGTFLSFFAGVMYGFAYMPGLYIQNNVENASQNNNDYAFSMSTGIFLSSLMYFVVYCVFRKNQPKVYPEIILPSFITGK